METPSGDIAFLYLRDGEVINIKFRSLEKRFHQACVLPLPPPRSVWRDPSLFSMPAPNMTFSCGSNGNLHPGKETPVIA